MNFENGEMKKTSGSVKNRIRQTTSQNFHHRSHESLDRFNTNTITSFESLPSNNNQSTNTKTVARKASQSTYR